MTLDDFTSNGTKPATRTSTSPEDEDLFDFPLIEMVLQDRKRSAPRATPSTATSTEPAAPFAAAHSAQVPSSLAHAENAHDMLATVPATPHSLGAEREIDLLDDEAEAAAIEPEALGEIAPAELGDDEADELEIARTRRGRRTQRTLMRRLARAGSPLALLAGMLTLNLLTFGFFWYTSETFRGGLQDLRDELVLATRSSALARSTDAVQAASAQPAPTHPTPEKRTDRDELDPTATLVAPDEGGANAAHRAGSARHPLQSFEQTTLDLAAREVRDGEPLAARRRLYRLLALADRMDASVRADVEARARFAIAESYRSQAAAKDAAHANETPRPQEGKR